MSKTDAAILEATRELLIEQGVQGLTVEGVAARAGVAKTTIYRRYRSKHELALAVLFDMVQQAVAVDGPQPSGVSTRKRRSRHAPGGSGSHGHIQEPHRHRGRSGRRAGRHRPEDRHARARAGHQERR